RTASSPSQSQTFSPALAAASSTIWVLSRSASTVSVQRSWPTRMKVTPPSASSWKAGTPSVVFPSTGGGSETLMGNTFCPSMTSGGSFTFHFGVDISAPDGTAAFPVVSGKVTHVEADWIGLDAGAGRTFQYWHLDAAVAVGQQVQARTTKLGTIKADAGHVHL